MERVLCACAEIIQLEIPAVNGAVIESNVKRVSIQMKMASLVADYSSSENESPDDSSSDSSNQS